RKGARMQRTLLLVGGILALSWQTSAPSAVGQDLILAPKPVLPGLTLHTPEKKFEDFDKVIKGAKEYDGLFKLYHKQDRLYAEVPPDQPDKPLLGPIAIARGMAMGGYTLNFEEQWVLLFHKVADDKLHLVRRNVRYQAKAGSPAAKAVETTYTDSVLLGL